MNHTKFITRQQHDFLLKEHLIWFNANWNTFLKAWGINGVRLNGLTQDQFDYLENALKK